MVSTPICDDIRRPAPFMRRRLVRLGAVAALVAVSLTDSRPAAAFEKPEIKLKPGAVLVIKAPSPVVQGKVSTRVASATPKNCRVSMASRGAGEWCDSYPIRIDADDALLKTGNLQLNATLEFTPGTTIQNCPQIGNCGTNEMGLAIWQTPPLQSATGTDIATSTQGGTTGRPDTPMSVAHIGAGICAPRTDAATTVPKDGLCRLEHVLVANYLGSNPYTLRLELVDFNASAPVDRSIEDLPPVFDASAQPAGSTASAAPSAPSTEPTTTLTLLGTTGTLGGVGAPRVDLPGLGTSAGFDGLGPASIPASELAQKIVQRGPKALGPPAAANALLLLTWLVLLPLGGVAAFVLWLWRARRTEAVT